MIRFERVTYTYPFQTCPAVSDISFSVRPGELVLCTGASGCGKSTLMQILAGNLPPDAGSIEWGETLKIGYFAQECEVMDERQRVIDYIRDTAEYIRTTTGQISASRMLERFLFSPDMQYAPIAKISGGERRRLYLLKVLMGTHSGRADQRSGYRHPAGTGRLPRPFPGHRDRSLPRPLLPGPNCGPDRRF